VQLHGLDVWQSDTTRCTSAMCWLGRSSSSCAC
jgi:hypothetical protein